MKTTVGRLRALIQEASTDDVGGPTLAWDEWYEELDLAAGEAGYELLSDLPVYDFIASQSMSARQMERILVQMWKDGVDPASAVSQMEDPRSFWSRWGRWVPGDMVEGTQWRWLSEAKVAASPEYMKKEAVRQALQDMVSGMVADGRVGNQQALDEAFAALDMSVKALKMVPFEVWQRMAGGAPTKKKRA